MKVMGSIMIRDLVVQSASFNDDDCAVCPNQSEPFFIPYLVIDEGEARKLWRAIGMKLKDLAKEVKE